MLRSKSKRFSASLPSSYNILVAPQRDAGYATYMTGKWHLKEPVFRRYNLAEGPLDSSELAGNPD